ncbi:MAG: sugar porter family MFS transporter [Chitinophagaceae bacterium]|nr:sugar porter family MFS transporter [Chitinophagaceae bacterium]MDP1764676.1 sugar porter family MFS transporter [Sediminibacterium sp.]MDP1812291.1 sugar porter family MFS transporter [Sediminibacterium sp.]MDP3128869.1 sugar porter family MFS transporter [Sediminibacterium sp.]MDP3666024.1 sugar porter family MFS transporter [Sediminibacterium sp.]
MNQNKLLRWSIVVALAGFIFGFDTVVISGANQPIKELWHTSPLFHGFFIMSMALWGTVIGAMFGGIPTEKYGRKTVLLWVGILFAVSAFGSALAGNAYVFSFFRFMGGIGIGVSSVVAPIYISEISTPVTRGRLGALYQFNIVFGILIAFLSNYFLQGVGGMNDWRWMLGVLALPAVLYTALVFGISESPRWLITKKNDLVAAKTVLVQIGVTDVDAEIATILRGNVQQIGMVKALSFFSLKHKKIIWLAFMIAFFNQVSGINFILYYAPEILEKAGLAAKESLFNSIAIGGTNLIFTFVGLYLIDRLGRKTLLMIGSFGYILSLTMVSWAFYVHAGAVFLMSFLLLFIAAHAIGQGAVIWVFISEIFPNKIRSAGQAFGASVHWVFAALITLVTPVFLDKDDGIFKDNPWPIFAFFAGMMVLQLVWVFTSVPETKGVSLEELEKKLCR